MRRRSNDGLLIEFGTARLVVECAWRIGGPDGVLMGRSGHQRLFAGADALDPAELAAALLVDAKVTEARVNARTGDVVLTLAGARTLEIWNDAAGVDAWTLIRPGLSMVVAGADGVRVAGPAVP
ncbi:MAG: hypothetical protein MUF30_10195 [Burkholderiales bacterium]|nr:hypothetical protein [Burkholderiales bacterium]